jgi:hypothetical protein
MSFHERVFARLAWLLPALLAAVAAATPAQARQIYPAFGGPGDANGIFECQKGHYVVGDGAPVLLGRGEAMFAGLDLPALGYRVIESTATGLATHVVLRREENE